MPEAFGPNVPLLDGWSLWPAFALRGAGFPVAQVLELAAPQAVDAIDRLLEAEEEVERLRRRAVDVCLELERRSPPETAAVARRMGKRLRKGRSPEESVDDARVTGAVGAFLRSRQALEEMERAAQEDLDEHALEALRMLRAVAEDGRFRAALTWQNRSALVRGVERLAVEEDGSRMRQHGMLVASYLQRYCTKNETIGFFGPVGFGAVSERGPALAVKPGPALISSSVVRFEYWAMDALAQELAEDPRIRPDLQPRRWPHLRVEGDVLHHPGGRTTPLDPDTARLLLLCDGARTARELARELGDPEEVLDDVLEALEELAEIGAVSWTIELPTAGPPPEEALSRILERIKDDGARARATAALEALQAGRLRVAAATDAVELGTSMAALEETFERLSGRGATRLEGQAYAGRTLLHQDCRRDVDVSIGTELIERIRAPLSMVATSARWFTFEIARRYRSALDAVFERAAGNTEGETVELLRFWSGVEPLFPERGGIVDEVAEELSRRWAEILEPEDGPRVERRASDLEPRVTALFDAPGCGWPSARHHAPDLLIAAQDAEQALEGDYLVVLGELHAALNTLTNPFMMELHPRADALLARREAELPAPGIAPVWSKARTRADFYSASRHDLDLEQGRTRSWRPRDRVIAAADLVVRRRDGRLEVVSRDGGHRFDIIAFLDHHLTAAAHGRFDPSRSIGSPQHRPRVTIDRFVLCREGWQCDPSALSFAREKDPRERFVAARRWARSMRLPRFLFYKIPEEAKPAYLDLCSPIYVEMFSKQVRKASALSLSEMLPAPPELWLPDASGARYTSELRMALTDERSFMAEAVR